MCGQSTWSSTLYTATSASVPTGRVSHSLSNPSCYCPFFVFSIRINQNCVGNGLSVHPGSTGDRMSVSTLAALLTRDKYFHQFPLKWFDDDVHTHGQIVCVCVRKHFISPPSQEKQNTIRQRPQHFIPSTSLTTGDAPSLTSSSSSSPICLLNK